MDNRHSQNIFQNELQNILSELLFENMGYNNIPRNTFYRRNQNQRQDNMFYIIQSLRETMNAYNENIREYGSTIRFYLQILELMIRQENDQFPSPIIEPVTPPANTIPRRQRERTRDHPRPPTPTRNQFLSYLIYPLRDMCGNILRRQSQQFQNVIVRPTLEQINNATTPLVYDSEMQLINHQCPIRLEDFENGQAIRQIIHCGHCFFEESIQNWFRSNVRCPVCRYDIRDHIPENTNQTDISGNETEMHEITNDMINGLTTNITNIINNYVNRELSNDNNDLVYSFEMPIYYNDVSGTRFFA
jgi:Ring finger domain